MITWTVGLTARSGRENSFVALANELTETSNRLDAGCVVYICLQNLEDARDFLWYEQWATMPLLEKHVARISPMLRGSSDGPEGSEASRLDAAIERREQLGYDVLQDAEPAPRDWAAAGITSWVEVRTKPGREQGFRRIAAELSRSGQASEGCISHIAHQREDDPPPLQLARAVAERGRAGHAHGSADGGLRPAARQRGSRRSPRRHRRRTRVDRRDALPGGRGVIAPRRPARRVLPAALRLRIALQSPSLGRPNWSSIRSWHRATAACAFGRRA